MITLVIFIVLFAAFLAALIFSRDFRRWISDSLTALGRLIVHYFPIAGAWVINVIITIMRFAGVYALVVGAVALFALILVILAFIFGSPVFTGIAFVLALSLVLITWLPAGLILRLFRVNSAVIPAGLKAFVAWVAFVGFIGMIFPDLFAFKTLIGAALVALIFLGVSVKINAVDKIAYPLVLLMCLTLVWQHFFPEDFRSSVRYTQSWSKRVNSSKDRGSIENETEAATSYAQLLKDVDVLYVSSQSSLNPDTSNHLKRGEVVRLVNHKDEVTIYDGQGFVNIQLKNDQGTYFKGPKYWIEAELVQIASPRDIVAKDKNLLPSNQIRNASMTRVASPVRIASFGTGTHVLPIQPGETVRLITTPSKDGCGLLSMSSKTFSYQFKFDGNSWKNDGPNMVYPYMRNPTCLLRSQNGDVVTIKVL